MSSNSTDVTDSMDFPLCWYQGSWESQNIDKFDVFDGFDRFNGLFFVLVPGEVGGLKHLQIQQIRQI